jgi:hypothetical protein
MWFVILVAGISSCELAVQSTKTADGPKKDQVFEAPGTVIDGLSSRDNVTGAVTNKPTLVVLIAR